MYAYTLTNRRRSSRELGNCECCNQFAPEVWLQVESKACPSRSSPGSDSYAMTGKDLFGHRDCLIAEQRAA